MAKKKTEIEDQAQSEPAADSAELETPKAAPDHGFAVGERVTIEGTVSELHGDAIRVNLDAGGAAIVAFSALKKVGAALLLLALLFSSSAPRAESLGVLIPSASYTTSQVSSTVAVNGKTSCMFQMTTTNIGTGSVTFTLQAKDQTGGSGVDWAVIFGAAVVTNTTSVYVVDPGFNNPGSSVTGYTNMKIPNLFAVRVIANNANPATYSVVGWCW